MASVIALVEVESRKNVILMSPFPPVNSVRSASLFFAVYLFSKSLVTVSSPSVASLPSKLYVSNSLLSNVLLEFKSVPSQSFARRGALFATIIGISTPLTLPAASNARTIILAGPSGKFTECIVASQVHVVPIFVTDSIIPSPSSTESVYGLADSLV